MPLPNNMMLMKMVLIMAHSMMMQQLMPLKESMVHHCYWMVTKISFKPMQQMQQPTFMICL